MSDIPLHWNPWSQEGTICPSPLQRSALNLPNIDISSLLQSTQMFINYTARSSVMSTMPVHRNINLLYYRSRECGTKQKGLFI